MSYVSCVMCMCVLQYIPVSSAASTLPVLPYHAESVQARANRITWTVQVRTHAGTPYHTPYHTRHRVRVQSITLVITGGNINHVTFYLIIMMCGDCSSLLKLKHLGDDRILYVMCLQIATPIANTWCDFIRHSCEIALPPHVTTGASCVWFGCKQAARSRRM